jgi:hypothetical protein
MGTMMDFEEVKKKLNDQWLDYYEINQSWIKKTLPKNQNGYPEQKQLCYLVLGIVSAFEPKLKDPLTYFTELNSDPEALVKVLGIETLAIDHKIQERKQKIASSTKRIQGDSKYAEASKHLDEIRQSINEEENSS